MFEGAQLTRNCWPKSPPGAQFYKTECKGPERFMKTVKRLGDNRNLQNQSNEWNSRSKFLQHKAGNPRATDVPEPTGLFVTHSLV